MDKYLRANRDLWDEMTPIHAASEFYDVEGFKRGRCTLTETDREEVGDVSGKSLLHLQCHFGLDTLSWARLGARVTGVDFSPKAIELARSLAKELGIPAEFVCSNVYDLPEVLAGEFDIVYTSQGVLPWLPDLERWGAVIAHFLEGDGFFYIFEFHPFEGIFDDDRRANIPRIRYPYFHKPEPIVSTDEERGTYAADAVIQSPSYEWPHSLSEIINSLITAGLCIEYLHEFPFITYRSRPFLERGEDGLWRYPEKPDSLPLMFSLKAVRR